LPTAIRKALNLLETAAPLWLDLHRAALLVADRFTTMRASRRDADLEAVLFPKNLRGRDGEILQRIDRVRYIQAIRSLRLDTPPEPTAANPKPASSARGLTDVPLNRGTEPPARPAVPDQLRSLRPALNLLQRIAWHPEIDEFIRALCTSSELGKQKLTAMVIASISDAGSLANRIADDSRRVWRLHAALRIGIASIDGLTPAEKNALTLFAIAVAKGMKTSMEEALEAVGIVVTMLALFGGPLAPVAMVADAIIQGAGAAVSFIREVDQDRAESSSIFQKQGERLSTGGRYLEPAAQAMGALLAAAAVPGAVSQIAREATLVQKAAGQAERVPTAVKAAESAALTADEQAVKGSIRAAASEEQDIQRGLQKGRAEEAAAAPKDATTTVGAPETTEARVGDGESRATATKKSELEITQDSRKVSTGRPELEREAATVKENIRHPENIRDVLDPELAKEYDFQIWAGDEHSYYHRRDGKGWCRASKAAICGYSFGPEVEEELRRAALSRRPSTSGKPTEQFVEEFLGPGFRPQQGSFEGTARGGWGKYGMSIADFAGTQGSRRIVVEVKNIDIAANMSKGFGDLRTQVGGYLSNVPNPDTTKFWLFLDLRGQRLPPGGFEAIVESVHAGTGNVFDNIYLITEKRVVVY